MLPGSYPKRQCCIRIFCQLGSKQTWRRIAEAQALDNIVAINLLLFLRFSFCYIMVGLTVRLFVEYSPILWYIRFLFACLAFLLAVATCKKEKARAAPHLTLPRGKTSTQ